MKQRSIGQTLLSRIRTLRNSRRMRTVLAICLAAVVLIGVAILETRFSDLKIDNIRVDGTPVTLYRLQGSEPRPAVIVAHGFGGSRQMMDQIAVSLARNGFMVASVDLPGHGRNDQRLSPDITQLSGTTSQLVRVVEHVAQSVATRPEVYGPMSYVGHSMASDIVIRASASRNDVGGVVAVSMYSPAVTDTQPASLLVLSGARETRLRAAALDAVRLVDPQAVEGRTVAAGDVTRRASVAPFVGHVGVLYAPTSLNEIAQWLRNATRTDHSAPPDRSGWIAGVVLVALVLLVWPLSKLVPARAQQPVPAAPPRVVLACLLAPIPAAILFAVLPVFGIAGNAGFGTLAAIFAAWGLVQLAILYRAGFRPGSTDVVGALIYLGFALVFAVALDRYGAAFVPTGQRLIVMSGLLVGTLPLMIADTLLVHNASVLRRVLVRLSFLVALSGAMAISPTELGLAFTTLPVLILFFLIYGTMARWIAKRRGIAGVALGKAIVLAWAIAASTPLFSASGVS